MTGKITVIKRDGREEAIDECKLDRVIDWACENHPMYAPILKEELLADMPDRVRTETITKHLLQTAVRHTSLIHPDWEWVAGRLFMLSMYKTSYGVRVSRDGKVVYPHLKAVLELGVRKNILLQMSYTEDDISKLNDRLVPERDFRVFRSAYIFANKYQKKRSKHLFLELPQHTYMRVAMFIMQAEEERRIEKTIALYDSLSQGHFTLATPIMLNAGTPKKMLSSCVLSCTDDSTDSLLDSVSTCALYSKNGGGLAVDFSNVRAKGSHIASNSSVSSGIVPFLKIIEKTLAGWNQCHPIDSKIWTERGLLSKDQIIVGQDRAINSKGKARLITNVFDNGVKETLVIKHSGGEFECTPGHRVAVADSVNTFVWKRADEITTKDHLVLANFPYYAPHSRFVSECNSTVPSIVLDVKEGRETSTFDIEVEGEHEVIVNGVVSHNSGARKGACVITFPIWHKDINDFLPLKSNGGTEDTRARHLQYSVKINRLFLERVSKNEEWTLFNPLDADLFVWDEEEYLRLEKQMPTADKINARELFFTLLKYRVETGNIYLFHEDNVNHESPLNMWINSSNLCVHPDTKVLTEKGYKRIGDGGDHRVWNGEEWSETSFEQTGINQEMLRVVVSNGREIVCTPYHKFYVRDRYWGESREVRACDLQVGQKIEKTGIDLPIISGKRNDLLTPYLQGFHSADGCDYKGKQHIHIYADKQELHRLYDEERMSCKSIQPAQNRTTLIYKHLRYKNFVPDNTYTQAARLEWFSGYLDGDGHVMSSNTLQFASVNRDFLHDVGNMLHEFGIEYGFSVVTEGGPKMMPKNDGSGEHGEFICAPAWRITIPPSQVSRLLDMGLKCDRLNITAHIADRQAMNFPKVVEVTPAPSSDTWCFNEPSRHRGIFNGIITGQCQEITLPSRPGEVTGKELLYDIDNTPREVITKVPEQISLCNLASINLASWIDMTVTEKQAVANIAVRALDNAIDASEYPVPGAAIYNRRYRFIGVGASNYAYAMVKAGHKFSSAKSLMWAEGIFRDLSARVITASSRLAGERGAAPGYRDTHWHNWIIERYGHELAEEVRDTGLRNCSLMAIAPTACQTLDGTISIPTDVRTSNDTTPIKLGVWLHENGVDTDAVEQEGKTGWHKLAEPQRISTHAGNKYVERVWYNGRAKTRIITFEDGSEHSFTLNHRLAVRDGACLVWKKVGELNEGDDILRMKRISGFEGYSITDAGDVYSHKRNKFLKILSRPNGYCYVDLYSAAHPKGRKISIHRMVAVAFLEIEGNMDDLQVNHINGTKNDNRVTNLEWSDSSHNQLHAVASGLTSPHTKGQREQIRELGRGHRLYKDEYPIVLDLRDKGATYAKIVEETGVPMSTVARMCRGQSYAN